MAGLRWGMYSYSRREEWIYRRLTAVTIELDGAPARWIIGKSQPTSKLSAVRRARFDPGADLPLPVGPRVRQGRLLVYPGGQWQPKVEVQFQSGNVRDSVASASTFKTHGDTLNSDMICICGSVGCILQWWKWWMLERRIADTSSKTSCRGSCKLPRSHSLQTPRPAASFCRSYIRDCPEPNGA